MDYLDFVPDAVFCIDLARKVRFWNTAMENMTGVSRDRALGQEEHFVASLLFSGLTDELLAVRALTSPPGTVLSDEHIVPNAPGRDAQHLWCRASPLLDEGRIVGALQTVVDISTVSKARCTLSQSLEEVSAAQQSYDQLLDIVDQIPDGIFAVDRDKRVIVWNRGMELATGVQRSQVLGTSDYSQALYGFHRPVLLDYLGQDEEAIRKQYPSDYRKIERGAIHNQGFMPGIYGGKGAYLSVMAAPLSNRNGDVIGAVESLRDLTDFRAKENALKESELLLRELTNNMGDMLCKVGSDGIIQYASPSHLKVAGFDPSEMVGKHFSSFVHPEDLPVLVKSFQVLAADTTKGDIHLEFRGTHATGQTRHIEANGSLLRNAEGEVTSIIYVSRDVTERKLLEAKLRYLGLYDHLTGAYNRAYFEQQLAAQDQNPSLPLAIITCDIDGLKLVNDTLGHASGDQLLIAAVSEVSSCLDKQHILARVGGDELAILCPLTTETEVQAVYRSIRERVDEYNKLYPTLPLSISVGYACASEPTPLYRLFERADNNMYREKLHQRQSARSSIVQTLMKALEARDYITEGHADRLQELVCSLALSIGLPENTLIELKLLAQFHDIGKVGIPDRILFKPGKLTPEEMAEMRMHCEIGNRIALASPDLAPIADWILKHHEWWNGEGYPLGLKGEAIPLQCRLLSIADAFDAMTSDRPYRKALTREEAVQELTRYAGTQFDPYLVERFIATLAE